MAVFLSNRPRLDSIQHLPVAELLALPAEHLALLQEDAATALEAARRTRDWLDGIVADLPKRVEWNQRRLAATVERIRANGGDPAEYVEISYKVPERAYTAWPEQIRAAFTPARTVRTGKPSFRLTLDPTAGGV